MRPALSTDFDSDATILALEQGETKVNVRLYSLDVRLRIARYEIAIANAEASVVSCRFCIVAPDGQESELGTLDVAPGSIVRSRLAVPISRWNDAGRVIVKVQGAGIAFVADAPQPEAIASAGYLLPALPAAPPAVATRESWRIKRVAAAAVPAVRQPDTGPSWRIFVALLFVAVCACGALQAIASGRAIAIDLHAPDHVAPGLVNAQYSLRGAGAATFEATDTNGSVVASGVLPSSQGEIAFIVPPEEAGRSIRLDVTARSWFREQANSAEFTVAAATKAPAPITPRPNGPSAQIGTLIARRDTLNGSPTVIASYLANGSRGMVQVTDARGALLGSGPLSKSGTTRVALSHDDPLQPLFARLDVAGANSQAEASFEIPPEVAVPSAAPSAGSAPLDKRGGPSAAPNRNFSVEQRVIAGHRFEVRIEHVLPQMAIAFQDQHGTVLDTVDVPQGARSVAFDVPASTIARMYYLVCTYGREEQGVESSILPIRAFPERPAAPPASRASASAQVSRGRALSSRSDSPSCIRTSSTCSGKSQTVWRSCTDIFPDRSVTRLGRPISCRRSGSSKLD